jgi:hypothetical protein
MSSLSAYPDLTTARLQDRVQSLLIIIYIMMHRTEEVCITLLCCTNSY